MLYYLVSRRNPLKREEIKWYAQPVRVRPIELQTLATDIESRTTLSRADVKGLLDGARTHRAIGGRKPRGAGRFGLFQTQNPQQRRKGKEEIHTEKHPRHARTLSLQHEVAPLLFDARRQCAPDAGKERKGPDARTEKRTIITPNAMLALRYRSRRAGKLTEIVFI